MLRNRKRQVKIRNDEKRQGGVGMNRDKETKKNTYRVKWI